jgi:DnaK suppressor protein
MSREEFVVQEQQKLLEEREDVVGQLEHLKEYMQAEVDVEPDEGDAEIVEREKNGVLIGVLERKLKDIDAALRSIDKGQYGICERCGEEIEIGRLEIKPDSTMCVKCQSEVERLARRGRPVR